MVYQRHPDVSFTRFGDDGLLVVPKGAWQIVLNGVGARTFELVDGQRSVQDIAATLSDELNESPDQEKVMSDVNELLSDLHQRGAVTVAGSD